MGFPGISAGKESACMQETWVRSLGWEGPLEKGKAYPLQYSGLENSRDCIAHGAAKNRTWLSTFTFTYIIRRQRAPGEWTFPQHLSERWPHEMDWGAWDWSSSSCLSSGSRGSFAAPRMESADFFCATPACRQFWLCELWYLCYSCSSPWLLHKSALGCMESVFQQKSNAGREADLAHGLWLVEPWPTDTLHIHCGSPLADRLALYQPDTGKEPLHTPSQHQRRTLKEVHAGSKWLIRLSDSPCWGMCVLWGMESEGLRRTHADVLWFDWKQRMEPWVCGQQWGRGCRGL